MRIQNLLETAAERFGGAIKLAFENKCDMQTQKRVVLVAITLNDIIAQTRRSWNIVKNICDTRKHRQETSEYTFKKSTTKVM